MNVNITVFWDMKTWDMIAKGYLSTKSQSTTSQKTIFLYSYKNITTSDVAPCEDKILPAPRNFKTNFL